jgi:hypothetical protein
MAGERGQSSVEWVALLGLVALVMVGALALAATVDGRSFGGFLTHRVVCAITAGCDDGEAALVAAYGDRDAELLRRYAPNLVYEPGERQLPVDPRRCRRPACAEAPDDREADLHRADSGERATAFTRVLRRDGRVYLQYHLYYPDSNTTLGPSRVVWDHAPALLRAAAKLVSGHDDYPGWHRDDWESSQIRIDPDGSVWARASSHGHYQGCKEGDCRDRWVEATGWSRVSRGSHAGHIPPELADGERTSTGEALRLVPLETYDRGSYRRLDEGILPPWSKRVYRHPEDGAS